MVFHHSVNVYQRVAGLGESKDPDGAARVLKCLHLGSARISQWQVCGAIESTIDWCLLGSFIELYRYTT